MYITLLKIRTFLNKKESRHENKVSLKKNNEAKIKKNNFSPQKTLRNLSDFLGTVSHINIPGFVLAFLLPPHIYQDNENSNCIVKAIEHKNDNLHKRYP